MQFFGHEEGRVRKVTLANGTLGWAYDYMLKDHLGNVRAVLTEEKKQHVYPAATLEDGAVGTEAAYYDIKSGNIQTMSSIAAYNSATGRVYNNNNGNPPHNNNPNSNTTANSQKMYRLNGATGDKTGLGIALKVMAGDVVNIFGKSYWHNNNVTPIQNNQLITTALESFLGSFTNTGAVAGGAHGTSVTGATLYANAGTSTPLQNWLNNTVPTVSNKPKANINWILFDERFIPVSSSSGFVAIGATDIVNSHTGIANITKNGYLYVYCSNESNINVFFDNLQVIHNKGALLEETHYYPFGLTMSGISSKAATNAPVNKRKFNDGTELENGEFSDGSGLELYSTDFRSYDAQIGRFHQIDLLAELNENWSPYSFAQNNPILYNDPYGLDTLRGATRPENLNQGDVWVKPGENGQEWYYTYDPNNKNAFTQEGYEGLVTNGGSSNASLGEVTVTAAPKKKATSEAPAPQEAPPANGTERGRREADIAIAYPGRDMRPYSMSDAPNTIDCSRFTREVATRAGYNIPRVAFDQARWYQRNGHWDNNVNNAQAGDHIFWQRGANAYHTGVVVSNIIATNGTRIIRVVQAQTYNHRPGSIQLQRLMANGQIRGFGQPFVGVGRYP